MQTTRGFIDAATVYELLSVFSCRKPVDCYPWAWMSAREATHHLIFARHLQVAPTPGPSTAASGLWGLLTDAVADSMHFPVPSSKVQLHATEAVRRWGQRSNRLTGAVSRVRRDANYGPWVDWHIRHEWLEHSRRLDGLFDAAFVNVIGAQIGLSPQETVALQERTRDLSQLESVVRGYKRHPDRNTELLQVLEHAWLVSSLLRGRYHEEISSRQGLQIVHHPSRHGILHKRPGVAATLFMPSAEELMFSNIVMASAFAETSAESRIKHFGVNLQRARAAMAANRVVFPRESASRDEAERSAALAAQRAGIDITPRRLSNILEVAAALGLGALTSFVLNPTAGLVATGGAAAVQTKVRVGPGLAALAGGQRRFAQLARAEAGPLRSQWSGLP